MNEEGTYLISPILITGLSLRTSSLGSADSSMMVGNVVITDSESLRELEAFFRESDNRFWLVSGLDLSPEVGPWSLSARLSPLEEQ